MRDQDSNIQTTLMAIHVLSLNLGLRTEGCRQPDGFYMEKSGYGKDRIFRSRRPPLKLLKDKNSNIVSFMFGDSTSEKLSFRDFKDKVSMVGNGLSQLDIRKGDVGLLFSPNSIHVRSCFLGIVSIGAVASTVNPLYTAMEVVKQVQDSNSKFSITVPELWDKVKD